MKKIDDLIESRIQKKREKNRVKRLRLRKLFTGINSTFTKEQLFHANVDRKIRSKFKSLLYEFLIEKKFIDGTEDESSSILIPSDFSFCKEYNSSIRTIRDVVASIMSLRYNKVTLDFSICEKVDQPALFVLQILLLEFKSELEKLDNRLAVLTTKLSFEIKKSPSEKVNKLLFVTGILPQVNLEVDGLMPIHTTGYHKGSKNQKHYTENKKGIIGTKIVAYVNQCLFHHGYIFNPEGTNYLEGLISEILNNAEDHSPFTTYYVTANLLSEMHPDEKGNVVGEMNLSFLNFGYSFFEGFEMTKEQNFETYDVMESLYNQVSSGAFSKSFTKENLFTIYALQDGITRLKFEEESRGTGTMKFINSFFAFGDYEDEKKSYHPNLSILTGGTQLICDNRFKPFDREGVYFISLNSDNDLAKLPERSNLKTLDTPFPGTLLTVRIYLNKDHISKKINENGNKED